MIRAMRVVSWMALIGAIGCDGDGSTLLGPEEERNVVAATIDGAVFTSDRVEAGLFGDSLDLKAYRSGQYLGLYVLDVDGPGTFSLEAQNWRNAMGTVSFDGEQWFLTSEGAGTGTVTLSTVTSERIAGTFSFVAYDFSWDPPYGGVIPVVVESGIFDIRQPGF